jgi:hypothetical protein
MKHDKLVWKIISKVTFCVSFCEIIVVFLHLSKLPSSSDDVCLVEVVVGQAEDSHNLVLVIHIVQVFADWPVVELALAEEVRRCFIFAGAVVAAARPQTNQSYSGILGRIHQALGTREIQIRTQTLRPAVGLLQLVRLRRLRSWASSAPRLPTNSRC